MMPAYHVTSPHPCPLSSQCEVNNPTGGCKLLKHATDSRKKEDFVRFLQLENGDKVAVLCEVTTDSGTKYAHVRCVFGGHEGYIKVAHLSVDYLSPAQALEPCEDNLMRCPACNDVMSDGSQCMCSS